MKTHVKVIVCLILSVTLTVSFFAVPVMAGDAYATVTFNYLPNDEGILPNDWVRWATTVANLNSKSWNDLNPIRETWSFSVSNSSIKGLGATFDWGTDSDLSGAISFYVGRSKFELNTYSSSDTVWSEPFKLWIVLSEAYSASSYFRISLRSVDGGSIGTRVGQTDWQQIRFSTASGNAAYEFRIPSLPIQIFNPGNYDGLSVHFDIQCTSMNSCGIGFSDGAFTINYGSGSSPNFPSYLPPDSGDLPHVSEGQQALLDDTQQGSDIAVDNFNSLQSDLSYVSTGLYYVSSMVLSLVNIEGISTVVKVSLSLGLFATLLSLTASIIGAGDRAARNKDKGSGGKKGK